MILKFFKTSLSQVHRNTILRGSLYLFSNDNQKGFKNFKRRKTNDNQNNQKQNMKKQDENLQQNKQKQFQNKKHEQENQHINKNQSSQNFNENKSQQAKTGRKFQRKKDIQSQLKKIQTNNSDLSKKQNILNTKKQQDISKGQNQNHNNKNFSNFQRKKGHVNKPIQKQQTDKIKEQIKDQNIHHQKVTRNEKQPESLKKQIKTHFQQDLSKAAGFNRFKRQTKRTPQNLAKQTHKSMQNNQLKNQTQAQKQKGFTNFQQKKPPNIQQLKQQLQKYNRTKNNQQQTNNLKSQDIDKEKKQNLSSFKRFQRKKHNKQMPEQHKNISAQPHKNTESQPQFTNQMKNQQPKQEQKPQKTPQQKMKQDLQRQLRQKQQLFKQKIFQFKQLKKNQLLNNKSNSKLNEFQKRIQQKIFQLTGFDINYKIQFPKFIKSNPFVYYILKPFQNVKLLILLFIGWILFQINNIYRRYQQQLTPQQMIRKLQTGQVYQIIFEQTFEETQPQIGKKYGLNAKIILKNGQIYNCVSNSQFQNMIKIKVGLLNSLNTLIPPIIITNSKKQQKSLFNSARFLLSMAMLFIFVSSIAGAGKTGKKAGGGGAGLFTQQSKSKKFEQKVNVKFNDVVGMQKAKEQIVQFIDFLKHPKKYHDLGAKIPRGALLTGPPGTGKTMIAKACAGQSNVPFFTISGSQFIEMYVGVGAQRVRDLFKQAKQAAPSIIFIDQIDAVGKKRSAGFGGGNDQRDNTLNQLLVEMDGFKTGEDVIVFAATNQRQVLDPALIRPGRFDRLVQIDLPDIEGRKQIFMVHLRPIVIDQQSTMQDYARRMATLTPGFSGAEIKNLCNQAAIMAARNGHKFVTMHDFELATQRVIGGVQKKSHLITPQTRRIVAYHQCGHGVASWFLQGANPLLKLTIIPRSKGSLGFAQYLPHQTQISNKKQLEDSICVILAGRISQQIFFGKISTGAYDDLQKAYNITKKLVTQYGMNENLGWLSFQQTEYAKHYSKQTQKKIDQQISNIIKNCTQRTRSLILQKRELIQKLATKLLQVQTIDLNQISDILGQRPFKPNKQYEQYLNEYKKIVNEEPAPIQQKKQQKKQENTSSMKTSRLSQYLL